MVVDSDGRASPAEGKPRKAPFYRHLKRHATRWSARLAAFLWSRLPLPVVQALGACLGRLIYRVARSRRRRALANLEACFGDRFTPAERRRILVFSAQNMVTSCLELFALARMKPEQILRLTDIEGREHLDAAVERGKGAMVITAHYGNWELLGAIIVTLFGHDLAVLARDSTDRETARLVNAARNALGMQVLSRDDLSEMIAWLRQGKVLGVLPDQRQPKGGLILDFMGRPATTSTGPAILALRTGAAIVPGFTRRLPNGRFHTVFCPPLEPPQGMARSQATGAYSQSVNDAVGRAISDHPEQWLWLHDRWRTGPYRPRDNG